MMNFSFATVPPAVVMFALSFLVPFSERPDLIIPWLILCALVGFAWGFLIAPLF